MARSVAAAPDETPARTLGRTRTATRSASDDGARSGFRKGADEGTSKASDRSSGRTAKRGFGAYRKEVQNKDFGTFRVPADQVKVIAFLEEDNFDLIYRHWVPSVTEDGRNVNVPRNCIGDSDDGVNCPLCSLGDEAKPVALFNVVDLDEPGKAQLWEAGPEIMRRVEKLYTELQEIPEAKGGPLSLNSPGVYAAVSREKAKSGRWEYTVKRVKSRDLDEDFGLDALDDDALAELKLFTIDDIKFNSEDELRDLAATLED